MLVVEKECQAKVDNAAVQQNQCNAEVLKTEPLLKAAIEALQSIKKEDVEELKTVKVPHDQVKLVISAVAILLKVS